MGRLVIKRSAGSIYTGKGLVFNRLKNKPSNSIGIPDDMFDWKVGKGISDAHLTLYYSPGRFLSENPDQELIRLKMKRTTPPITVMMMMTNRWTKLLTYLMANEKCLHLLSIQSLTVLAKIHQ